MLDQSQLKRKIHAIGSHRWIDIDNAVNYWGLPKVCPRIFAQNRQIAFVEYDGTMTFDEALEQGILLVDCGSGPTDNHARENQGLGLSSFSCAMRWLGANDPALARIAKAIDLWDTTGHRPKRDDDSMISLNSLLEQIEGWNIIFHDRPIEVLRRTSECFEALYAREWSRLAAIDDLASKSQWRQVMYRPQGAAERQIWVCLIESDQPTAMHVVRNRPGDERRADLIIVARSTPRIGRYQISSSNVPDPRFRVTVETVAQYLRAGELIALDSEKIPGMPPSDLQGEAFKQYVYGLRREWRQKGFHPDCTQWFLHEGLHGGSTLLLNGSIKHPNGPNNPASVLDPETVFKLVCMALESDRPIGYPCDDERRPRCVRSCPFFTFHLHACAQFRYQQRQQKEKDREEAEAKAETNVIPLRRQDGKN